MDPISIGLGAVIGIIVGFVICYFTVGKAKQNQHEQELKEAQAKADGIIAKAKNDSKRIVAEAESKAAEKRKKFESDNERIKKQKIAEAREKYARMKSEFQADKKKELVELKERRLEIKGLEKEFDTRNKEIEKRGSELDDQQKEIEGIRNEIVHERKNVEKQQKVLAKKREDLERATEEQIRALEKIGNLSEAEAREQILNAVRAKADTDALSLRKDILSEAKNSATRDAKKIIIQTIQRTSAEFTIENTVTVFNLDSDDLKGQIIGREGRNIRALEAATGAEIVVDDTPEAIVISSFDPIRREVCRLSLKRLVADGRIHPARIEEVVNKTRKELDQQIVEIGERTVIELDIHGLKPYLVRMVGRMQFRSSYGQNLLKHSIETANLCAIMAAELGFSQKQAKIAKRAGLLHDIGKVAEEDTEMSHAIVGMKICETHGESEVVCNAVGAHHDEIEMNNLISAIVQACDAISGARPGARREILESYLKRIGELEEVAMSYDNVTKAFAMQAGRELRVIVESDKVTDQYADDLAFQISEKIQNEMQYPGQIKVIVIREKRAVSFAR